MTQLEQKLAEQEAALAERTPKANRLPLDFAHDNERLEWSCSMEDLLASVKKSSSGESEGLMVALTCRFSYKAPNGKTYHYDVRHGRGGGAWIIAELKGVESATAPKSAS